jgi:hydrogenase maturation protease
MAKFAVLGVGNTLMTDDGVGVHALEQFAAAHPDPDVDCLDAGTVGLALMSRLGNLDGLVAVDAMRLGKPPGTITVLADEAMDAHLRKHHGSVHELGLSDIMDALRLAGDLPARRALVGIEPEAIDWGTEPSSTVAAAIPGAVAAIHDLITTWKKATLTETAA